MPVQTRWTLVPKGQVVVPDAGDFILTHSKGVTGIIIRLGETLRFHSPASWSHAAFCLRDGRIIEALWSGVTSDDISRYRNVDYIIAHTSKTDLADINDKMQAIRYVLSCERQGYGWTTLLGTATRFLIPGHDFWFGSRANICSGLVAQALSRGWAIFDIDPSTLSPYELANYYNIPENSAKARV